MLASLITSALPKNVLHSTENVIFVSGAPRSGTTFMGNVLGRSVNRKLLTEPFNPEIGLARANVKFPLPEHLPYSGINLETLLIDIVSGRYPWIKFHDSADSYIEFWLKKLLGSKNQWQNVFNIINVLSHHAIIKDPTATFLIRDVLRNTSARVILMYRHPASFLGSVKRLGWTDWGRLGESAKHSNNDKDLEAGTSHNGVDTLVERAMYIWLCSNQEVVKIVKESPNQVCLVSHDDLCGSPMEVFEMIFKFCGYRMTHRDISYIKEKTYGNTKEVAGNQAHVFDRRSENIFHESVRRLSASEREYAEKRGRDLWNQLENLKNS